MAKRIVAAGLATVLVFACLSLLGAWQVRRMYWKQDIIARISAGLSAPPAGLQTSYPPDAEFSHVIGFGRLETDRPLYVYGRTLDGTAGVHVLVAMIRSSAPPVLVDRGFVALPLDAGKATAPSGTRVEGIVRRPIAHQWFDPADQPAKNEWFTVDPAAMGQALGHDGMDDFYIEATAPTGDNGPIPTGGRILANIPNNHLQYALTWFGLAAVCAAMFGAWAGKQILATGREAP